MADWRAHGRNGGWSEALMYERDKFEATLVEVVDVQLRSVFGETATSIIYNYLNNALSLRKDEIPSKLEVFVEGLGQFLSSGAKVVEKVILEELYSDLGKDFQVRAGYEFMDYIGELKSMVRTSDKSRT